MLSDCGVLRSHGDPVSSDSGVWDSQEIQCLARVASGIARLSSTLQNRRLGLPWDLVSSDIFK